MLETVLAGSIATIDGSILEGKSHRPMSLKKFQNWLRKHDNDQRKYPFNRPEIYKHFGLSTQKIKSAQNTYKKLSKYSHTSKITFLRPISDPYFHSRLTVNQPLFDIVFSLTMKSIDASLYCYINALVQITNMHTMELKTFMKDCMKYEFGYGRSLSSRKAGGFVLPRNVPLTWSLIKKLSK
jgi:hypothetical protein